MKSRVPQVTRAAFTLLFAFTLLAVTPSRSMPTEAPNRPLLLVHYMPWFAAPPQHPAWGWHWTMNAFDPEKKADGKRRIAAHYYPLIGPYDSGDPAVVEYHFLLMKLAGIDGLVVDWYGLSEHADYPQLHRNTAGLFAPAARVGLRVGVCYEDKTISNLVEARKLPAADRVKHAREVVAWLRQHWFTNPVYLKLTGKPVLLSFGIDGLTDAEWQQVLPPTHDQVVYLSEQHRRPGSAAGAFDWPVPKDGLRALDRYYRESRDWPVAMPAAYPRFHDIYADAHIHGSWGRIADDEGRTFVTTLRRALKSGAPFVQIVTWNDWGEGTMVEPSAELGYRDLEAVQRLRRQLIDPKFAFAADDLRLPHRLFLLRKQAASRLRKDELDRIARLLAEGSLAGARAALTNSER